jgi:hypothetical protein
MVVPRTDVLSVVVVTVVVTVVLGTVVTTLDIGTLDVKSKFILEEALTLVTLLEPAMALVKESVETVFVFSFVSWVAVFVVSLSFCSCLM